MGVGKNTCHWWSLHTTIVIIWLSKWLPRGIIWETMLINTMLLEVGEKHVTGLELIRESTKNIQIIRNRTWQLKAEKKAMQIKEDETWVLRRRIMSSWRCHLPRECLISELKGNWPHDSLGHFKYQRKLETWHTELTCLHNLLKFTMYSTNYSYANISQIHLASYGMTILRSMRK